MNIRRSANIIEAKGKIAAEKFSPAKSAELTEQEAAYLKTFAAQPAAKLIFADYAGRKIFKNIKLKLKPVRNSN